MSTLDVKNTIRKLVSDALVPHYCCSCGQIGSVLCEHCKYNIVSEPNERCVVCQRPAGGQDAVCSDCRRSVPYKRGWCIGPRTDGIKTLIDLAKFQSTRAAARTLAELLDASLPPLPRHVTVVAVPTIRPHVRERGYDHVAYAVREFARIRGLSYSQCLARRGTEVQHGAGRATRIRQAQRAFMCNSVTGVYLLIDDIFTTGSTLKYATKALLRAGASEVWIAVVARQPFEK